MADSSYSSEVQAILAFLSLQRTGGGGSGNHPQGPDASAEGLNPYGLVAPRFQRKFKAKQVPEGVGGGNGQRVYRPPLPLDVHRAFLWKCTRSLAPSPTWVPETAYCSPPSVGVSRSSCPCPPQGPAQLTCAER